MWSITQLRSIRGSPLPRAVAAESGCAPDFSSAFFDGGQERNAETASNASPAAARTPRFRSAALQSAQNAISILLDLGSAFFSTNYALRVLWPNASAIKLAPFVPWSQEQKAALLLIADE